MPVTIGVLKETLRGENRVAVVPEVATRLVALGARVLIERGAGAAARFPDAAYKDVSFAESADAVLEASDLLLTVQPPAPALIEHLKHGAVVVGYLAPHAQPALVRTLKDRRVTSFAMELVPRISRAQSMDALSSQAAVAGYKAVLLAAVELDKFFPMLTTAAGTIRPATVLVIGAGVAGLQAIATARRLGAVVEAYDVRAAAAEEVKSLGARFVEFDLDTGQEGSGSGAYATRMTDEQIAKQRELMAKVVAKADVVITTAQVQGATAPTLLTEAMVEGMAPGSVVVDLAAEQGGNVESSRPGEVVQVNGVTVIGPANINSDAAHHSSLVYAKNVQNFLALILKDGQVIHDDGDDLLAGSVVARGGSIVNERVKDALGAGEGVTS